MKRKQLVLPDWVKKLPDDACLKSTEVLALVGLKGPDTARAVSLGLIPEPIRVMGLAHWGGAKRGVLRLQWTVASLKKHVQQQQSSLTKEEVWWKMKCL